MTGDITSLININGDLILPLTISGEISAAFSLNGTLNSTTTVEGTLTSTDLVITGDLINEGNLFGEITVPGGSDADIYTDNYTVNPSFQEQTLNTKGKKMVDDVLVFPIQVSKTANLSGGNTVYIGGEINYG